MRSMILAGGATLVWHYTSLSFLVHLPIGDVPILDIVICQLVSHGVRMQPLALGYLAELLRAYFADGEKNGVYFQEDQDISYLFS
jgi:NDP-sugar pyrophosphorylase family protein